MNVVPSLGSLTCSAAPGRKGCHEGGMLYGGMYW